MAEAIDILRAPYEEVRQIQDRNLRRMIALCFQGHPYYQQVFKESRLQPTDFQTVDDHMNRK